MSAFDQVFDVVVVGSGHAGYAATQGARQAGLSVLLIGPAGALVWESGRSFHPAGGGSGDPEWLDLVAGVTARGGRAGDWLDGAITEVVATDRLLQAGASVLYYVRPVAAERQADALAAVILATKAGLRRVAGRQWIDATETGELARLLGAPRPRAPRRQVITLALQHNDWASLPTLASLRPTAWPTERILPVEVAPAEMGWRQAAVLTALEELAEQLGDAIAGVSLSHMSFEPLAAYGPGERAAPPASNVALAVPGLCEGAITTLADRFALGVRALADLGAMASHAASQTVFVDPIGAVTPASTLQAEVCVAGAGTGGVMAALAAARAGARVICTELMPFAGGVGVGGGIHGYYYGVPGGLQHELDDRTRALMKSFSRGPLADGPFNPWAKLLAVEGLLLEADVDLHLDGLVFDVERQGDLVRAVLIATRDGVLRIDAETFVDCTGDGDLCALAGAEFSNGRPSDGLLHAYSQPSGRLQELKGRPRMKVATVDCGFCDPTDPEDLTRGRLAGVRQYLFDAYDNFNRPTYIAPVLGIRQSRQILTDYTLTLDDQIRRRRFDDAIGYTGAHYDSHATDCEFESDEAVFWVWVNRQYTHPFACELSYRMLLPQGLANVWIASRSFGVSQDAHAATRMQRDIQRAGEAAGFAAAEAARQGVAARDVPYPSLRRWLDSTGAFSGEPARMDTELDVTFEFIGWREQVPLTLANMPSPAESALAALDRGEPGESIWWLYRQKNFLQEAVLERLMPDLHRKPMVAWLAAAIIAMWRDAAAEPRLIKAVENLEYGFGPGYEWAPRRTSLPPASFEPLEWNRVVPNWLTAVALLRRCGTPACLDALETLVARPVHGLNSLTSVALTLEQLAIRHTLGKADLGRIEALLDAMREARVIGAWEYAARNVGRYAELAVRGETEVSHDTASALCLRPERMQLASNTMQDNRWQLDLAIARARRAIQLPVEDLAARYAGDDRVIVRRAFRHFGA